jgi:hypothetical protein
MHDNSEVHAAQCDRMVTVRLEGPLQVVGSLAETGSRDAHRAEVKTPVEPSNEAPITMTGDDWLQKPIERGTPAKGQWCSR